MSIQPVITPAGHLVVEAAEVSDAAENKRDPDRPFAFLATYTHRMSAQAKLLHLPLKDALTQYFGEKNQQKLDTLLEPVRRAADECPLVREMRDSGQLFQPQVWTIGQAHRFLTSVPQMEQAGLVVRVPDWWQARQTSRPEVRVRIGQLGTGHVGTDSLLDFSVDLALDGEPLTDAEREQILQATDGLALLRRRWVEVDHEKLQQALKQWRALEQQYADGVDFIQGMRMLAGVRLGKDEADEETAGWTRVTAGDWLSDTLRQLRDPSGIVDCEAVSQENLSAAFGEPSDQLAGEDLGAMFGIELDAPSSPTKRASKKRPSRTKHTGRKTTTKAQSPKKKSAKTKPARSKAAGRPKSAGAKTQAAVTKKANSPKERQSTQRATLKKSPKKKSAKKKSPPRKSSGRKPSRKKTT